jgi:NAD(P)-dependent dehydrogenase (short-subunit alcohol dehydrogenase family)
LGTRLAGKVAVITGAAGGIGLAAVRRFLQEGAAVVAVDRDAPRLSASVPADAVARAADVTVSAEVEELLGEVARRLGRLDILFNVVGGSGRRAGDGPVDLCTEEGWDYVMNVNLRSLFLCCKHAVPLLRRSGGGSIINMGSVLGMVGHPLFDTHAYAASKGGVIALTRAMAVRYAPEQIRVNVLCPGLIRTPMSARAQSDPAVLAELQHLQPLTGEFGRPEDVAEAALFLGSDESRFVTGAVLTIDGGWTAR